jgi:hypothetical protein
MKEKLLEMNFKIKLSNHVSSGLNSLIVLLTVSFYVRTFCPHVKLWLVLKLYY